MLSYHDCRTGQGKYRIFFLSVKYVRWGQPPLPQLNEGKYIISVMGFHGKHVFAMLEGVLFVQMK